ncbi:RDD family protein [Clostridium botulinum]|uniref:RDD family protein n=1 Tax=unclassified Clostridium TaxID=2614128 RepID=UPI000306E94F|nr:MULTISPECIES: RDD family protein [unclassified Clostridium]MBN1050951.1 RDD family protein [Clostridium botulinum]MBN1054247.1 RDD family protein [Clostridium botulinum]NFN92557.1 RDD family protein [Clostridium botulinum]NFS27994.1 RDD family protein [Clostridium botulinum]NFS54320.1 RDD family protein [Clostridium botulinum]
MSKEENNINEKEDTILNDTKAKEETNNETKELLMGETNENNSNEEENPSLLKKIFASVIDQLVTISISGIALIIFDFIIGFMGYKVSMPIGILIIFYFIVNALYMPLMEKTKLRKSIGRKVINIK